MCGIDTLLRCTEFGYNAWKQAFCSREGIGASFKGLASQSRKNDIFKGLEQELVKVGAFELENGSVVNKFFDMEQDDESAMRLTHYLPEWKGRIRSSVYDDLFTTTSDYIFSRAGTLCHEDDSTPGDIKHGLLTAF